MKIIKEETAYFVKNINIRKTKDFFVLAMVRIMPYVLNVFLPFHNEMLNTSSESINENKLILNQNFFYCVH